MSMGRIAAHPCFSEPLSQQSGPLGPPPEVIMHLSRALHALLLSAAILAAPFSGSLLAAEAQPQPSQERLAEARAVQEAWETLMASHKQQLSAIIERGSKLKKELKELDSSTQAGLTVLEQEFQRLDTLSRVNGGMPSDLTVITERLKRVKERTESLIRPVQTSLDELSREKKEVSALEASLAGQKADSVAGLLSLLKQAKSNISDVENRYARAIKPAEELIGTIQSRIDAIVKLMPSLWHDYYFQSSGHFYDVVAWKKDFSSLDSVRELFSLRLSTEVPTTLEAVLVVFIRIAMTMALFLLLALALRRSVQSRMPQTMHAGLKRTLKNSTVWIALGVALNVAAWSDGKLYQMLATLGVMCLCWGQMLLAWDLYDFKHPERPRLSPLWPMFPSLLIGMILLNFDPFPLFICVAWVLVQAVDLWRARRRPLPEYRLPGVILRLHEIQLWLTLLISLAGFSRLAILVSMVFTSAAVTVMLCVSIFKVEKLIERSLPQEGGAAVVSSLIMALVMPLVLMLAGLASLLWILAYPGGFFLLQHLATLGFSVGSVSLNAMQIFSVFIAFYLTRTLLIVGNTLMTGMQSQISRISVSLLAPIQIIYKCILWGLFGLYALKALGFNLSSLSMVAGGLSVGIGLGMQTMVQNFTSGLSVIFGQTIREGDVVEVGAITGTVKKINIRNTMLQTFDNAIVFIPNTAFLSGTFINWTHNDRKVRKEIMVGVAYGSDVDLCTKLMLDIAKAHPQVLYRPAPAVLFMNFGPSSLDLVLRFWTSYDNGATVMSDVRQKINQVFAANGIEISFPQMDLHLRTGGISLPVPAKPEKNDEEEKNA
ncbi:mechanosensitive ion channel domain-containing protein [Mailhella sp.]|uniref:mechanosensitive ion channel domain-containing protein n=1 Tax=Mailhella sp. TaxID=1981029 RepID=UPI004062E37B